MATHDYVIDNGTGSAVRTDINNVLSAIVSNNSSSSEPSTKYAYQWWADTTTGILKIRNSSNNGWVELLQLDGTLTLEDGSNSTPGLAFRDDLNTGIFSSAADTLDITCGGTTRGSFSASGLAVTGTCSATTLTGTLSTAAQTNITSLGTLTGLTLSGDMTFTGASANVVFDKSDNALEFADNAKAIFGTGSDLEIYHDASNSIIFENGTGVLKLATAGASVDIVKGSDSSETMAKFIINGACELYHDNTKKIETASGGISLTGGAAANVTALTDGSTITIDMATACHHSVTLGGNRTFAAPSNQAVGQSGSIFITQDGTGSRTASFNSAFKFAGGTAPTLSTAANAVDRIDYVIKASNVIHSVITLDVK